MTTPVTPTTTFTRMSLDVYAQLERQLRPPLTTSQTSVLEAGEIIGIQRVLKLLREGFVIGAS